MVDKLSVISFTLFLIADGFAVASLCMPDWIVTNVGGKLYLKYFLESLLFLVMAPGYPTASKPGFPIFKILRPKNEQISTKNHQFWSNLCKTHQFSGENKKI